MAEAWAAEAVDAEMQLASVKKEGEAAAAAAAAAAAPPPAAVAAAADEEDQTGAAVKLQSAQRAKVGRCKLKPAGSLKHVLKALVSALETNIC